MPFVKYLLLLAIGVTSPLHAYYFTGGPINDILKNNGALPTLRSDQQNILNQLGKEGLLQLQKSKALLEIFNAVGRQTAVTLPGPVSVVDNTNIQAIMARLAELKREDPANATSVAVLEREVRHLEGLKIFQAKLAEMNTRSQRPMSFTDRMILQQDLKILDSQLFIVDLANKAQSDADLVETERQKQVSRAEKERRDTVKAAIGVIKK